MEREQDVDAERLRRQMAFVVEIDKVKRILRQTMVIGSGRHENDAEHSWHLAVMAILLAEYVEGARVDVTKVLRMVLVHDLVEIDAGDTYCYDEEAAAGKLERETRAADRIFGLLPGDQAREFRALWEEFEERGTPESRFANALDRLQPLLLNYHTDGRSWQRHAVTSDRVLERGAPIADSAPSLWEYAAGLIREAVEKGILEK
jgi:putative hydrolase of HD superfamily